MNTLLTTMLIAATVAHSPNHHNEQINYALTTLEHGQRYSYLFTGHMIEETHQYMVYNMEMQACIKRSLRHELILSESLSNNWMENNDYYPNFSFKRNIFNNTCILTVRKHSYSTHMINHNHHYSNYYNHGYDNHRYYNHNRRNVVVVRPNTSRTRVVVRPNSTNRTRVVVRPHSNSRVIVRNRANGGTRVIVRPRGTKQHIQNVRNFHKKHKKHKKGHVKIKKFKKMYF